MREKRRILWLIAGIPLLITVAVLPKFPMSVPMHYNSAGRIDRWGSKYEELIFPILILLFQGYWHILICYQEKKERTAGSDREKQEAASNGRVLYFSALGMLIFFALLHFFILYSAWAEAGAQSGYELFPFEKFCGVGLGLICIITGNLMPKAKRNTLLGLRTVWSLKNDRIWALSQRVAGRLMMLAGAVILVVSLIWDSSRAIMTAAMASLVIVTAAATVYSYMAYRKYGAETE